MEHDELTVRFKNIEEDIKRFEGKLCEIVSWKVFIWIVGIFLTILIPIMGWRISVVNDLQAKVEANNAQFLIIQTQLAEIMTDIKWLKNQ